MDSAHPIRLVVTDDLRRSRLTVFFRWLLVLPHAIWLFLWGIGVVVAVVVSWFAAVIGGRVPAGLHHFIGAYVRYSTHVNAYYYLLANPFPGFAGKEGSYPVDLEIDPPASQDRLGVLLRALLAIPAWVLSTVFGYVLGAVALLGWFVCLALGRMPEGMRNLGAYCLRYQQQTYAYVFLLTSRYPSLAGGAPAESAGGPPAEPVA